MLNRIYTDKGKELVLSLFTDADSAELAEKNMNCPAGSEGNDVWVDDLTDLASLIEDKGVQAELVECRCSEEGDAGRRYGELVVRLKIGDFDLVFAANVGDAVEVEAAIYKKKSVQLS